MYIRNILSIAALTTLFSASISSTIAETTAPEIKCQWNGKRVAYLGDSITDKWHIGTTRNYWQDLQTILGIIPHVYGINGNDFNGVLKQAQKLKKDEADKIDAIFVFAGTNDYNASVPLGEWYEFSDVPAPLAGGKTALRKRRTPSMDSRTFRGRINCAMAFLKENFPTKQIILLTPIHRGFAKFSETNVQPDESFPNNRGLYIDSYVNAVKEAANVWAVPVIDLNSISGLFPITPSHAQFFHKKDTDLLHPNAAGHLRIAEAIAYSLLCLPSK